jgi:hypothetical protein
MIKRYIIYDQHRIRLRPSTVVGQKLFNKILEDIIIYRSLKDTR